MRPVIQTLDQALSAVINLTLTLLAARIADLNGLGQLNLALTVYVALIGLQRAVIIESMLAAKKAGALRGAQPSSLVMSLIAGLLIALVGVFTSDEALVVLGVGAPVLLLVDVLRYSAFSMRRPGRALITDMCWLALLLASVLAGLESVAQLVAWWALSALVAAVVGLIVNWNGRWRAADFLVLKREMRGRSPQGMVDTLLLQLGWYIPVAFALDSVASGMAGEYRIAISLMAPMGVILTSWTTSTFVLVRESDGSRKVASRRAWYIMLLSIGYAIVAVLLREDLVAFLFGPNISVSFAVMMLVALQNPTQAPGSQLAAWFKFERRSWIPVLARAAGSLVVLPAIWVSGVTHNALWCVAGIPSAMAVYSLTIAAIFAYRGKRW